MRLQRLYEERDREIAAAKVKAEELRVAEERAQREWEAELEEIRARREGMPDDQLEQDCLTFYTSFEGLLRQDSSEASHPLELGAEPGPAVEEDAAQDDVSEAESRGPEGPLECWLARTLGAEGDAAGSGEDGELPGAVAGGPAGGSAGCRHWLCCRWHSFGELPAKAASGLAAPLVEALAASAEQAERRAAELTGKTKKVPGEFSEEFDELLARYAAEDDGVMPGTTSTAEALGASAAPRQPAEGQSQEAAEATAALLHARATRHRAVARRVEALAPCLEGDSASSRLVAALAARDFEEVPCALPASWNGGGAQAAVLGAPGAGPQDFRGFRGPLQAVSAADACWALCSEKRRLIAEQMLPSVTAEGRWHWPQLRRSGLGWWLCGAGAVGGLGPAPELEQLDAIVTRLAQSAVAQLRHYEKTGKLLGLPTGSRQPSLERTESCNNKGLRRLTDEAFFWYALMGTKLAKLRALMKTGVLRSEPGLAALLQHPRSDEPQFIRKNAFRLLQLHRYHLAAALFLVSESHEEAARVVATRLRDLQLMLVLTRRRPEVSVPLLRDRLSEPLEVQDPWLRVLLAWHAGDPEAWRRHTREAAGPAPATERSCSCSAAPREPELFDGALRPSAAEAEPEGLAEVVRILFGPAASGG